MLRSAPSLKRLLTRLLPRVGRGRRTGADDRNHAVDGDWVGLLRRAVHLCLCRDKSSCDRHAAGSHKSGYFTQGCQRQCGESGHGGLAAVQFQRMSIALTDAAKTQRRKDHVDH
jgi:hypothetical protein